MYIYNMDIVFVILLIASIDAQAQKKEGDSCVEDFLGTKGICVPANQCQSANNDFNQGGISATFCDYNPFGVSLVCCRDPRLITRISTEDPRQVWGTVGGDGRRISERKCEEYSRGVTEKVDYIPLVPDPETLSISAAKCDYSGVELIVGGENAKRGEFPHMAALGWANYQNGYSFLCGGSLISGRYVLTAAHCLHTAATNLQDPEPVIVRLGDQNIDPRVNDGASPVDVPIRKSTRHPDYKPPSVYNDIALLELATDVEFSAAVRPACLWNRMDFGNNRKAIVTGWGVSDFESGQTAKELQKVSLSLLEAEYCDQLLASIRNRNWRGLSQGQLCAGELRGGKDSCQGDSGSPLQVVSSDNQCIFYVMGVTSFGKRCGDKGRPAVYTKVAHYLGWIEAIVWPGG